MSSVESALGSRTDAGPVTTNLTRQLLLPAVISVVVVVLVLLVIVGMSRSAWQLLALGRGFVPPEYYHVSGFIVVLATTLGQAAGWAGGSGVAYYILTLIGFPRSLLTGKIAMSVVYLGLGAFPLLFYHVVFGPPLLGMPREGLKEWLLETHPDAHWLLYGAHPFVDGSLIPLAVVFLALLWFTGDAPRRNRAVQTVIGLAFVGTSLSVSLSLGIHSTLAHIRLHP